MEKNKGSRRFDSDFSVDKNVSAIELSESKYGGGCSSHDFQESLRDSLKTPLIPTQERRESNEDFTNHQDCECLYNQKYNENPLSSKLPSKPFIGTYEEADEYLKDNPEIRTGYRIGYSDFCIIMRSLFICHNETVNIWTHLLGFLGFFCIIFYIAIGLEATTLPSSLLQLFKDDLLSNINEPDQRSHTVSKVPLGIHIICAMICFFLSSTFHLFNCHSENAQNVLSRFDYGGIAVMIAGSSTPIYIYLFWCPQVSIFGYTYTFSMVAGCSIAFGVSLIPKFDAPEYRFCRAILFMVVGLSSAIPAIHIIGFRDRRYIPAPPMSLLILGGAIYILGALIYSSRFPERFNKDKKRRCNFDYIGNSHNIWHCFVLAGAGVHFAASVIMFKTCLSHQCPA
ncbi:unnamed protein product [Moneuplotes crassus]|uniref:Uncharacterized protein n=1 Tax=Euplotes crassus TaxID=5936 RepID=A0AAD1U8B4_EUPCR|nr:unnamed protein product [Moneuplotes crassus]